MDQSSKGMKKPLRPALGRGLSALISAAPVAVNPEPTSSLVANTPDPGNLAIKLEPVVSVQSGDVAASSEPPRFLPLSALVANPTQPRQHFSETEIEELSNSIRTLGVIQPILVRPTSIQGTYEIVAGERRFRAATRVGLAQVPVIIRELSERETLEVALVENVQRQNLNPLEEAKGYQRLIDEFNLTAQEVAEKVGKDRATVANAVRILRLPPPVQDMVSDGRLTMGHAKAILTVKEPAAQISLAKKVEEEHLSVRALEAIVSRSVVLEPPKKLQTSERIVGSDTHKEIPYPELEDRLRSSLGTKVSIRKNRQGGAIELHFFSDDELTRLVDILGSSRE